MEISYRRMNHLPIHSEGLHSQCVVEEQNGRLALGKLPRPFEEHRGPYSLFISRPSNGGVRFLGKSSSYHQMIRK